jgi:hypothetical protein
MNLTMMQSIRITSVAKSMFNPALAVAALVLAGCGGGGSSGSPPSISLLQRTDAAATTATGNPACTSLTPFYWEIGNAGGLLASGTSGASAPSATTAMSIASASKWVFATYVVEKQGGALPADIPYLDFQSGYTNFSSCSSGSTVSSCLTETGANGGTNGDHDAGALDHFYYNGGHMQVLASSGVIGLGGDNNAQLASAIGSIIGWTPLSFIYTQPQLAGGIYTTPANYAKFLINMLGGKYSHMLGLLGSHAVCTHTHSTDCTTALYSPLNESSPSASSNDVSDESAHYSLGHWVEDDPVVGDGAFSSAGAFGFYPWIDKSKTYYGILARYDPLQASAGYKSFACGRLIRKGWELGQAQ